MRAILLEWVMQICDENNYKRSTFHLAVNYVDRYLSVTPQVTTKVLQLIGLTALTIAIKIEEIIVTSIKDLATLAFNYFSVDSIIDTERSISKVKVI